MRIALVSEFYYPHQGGVTEHVHHLASYLVGAGHEVRVITNQPAEYPEEPKQADVKVRGGSYEVHRVGVGIPVQSNGSKSRATVGVGVYARVRELVRRVDIVHVQSPMFPMLPYHAIKAAKHFSIPTVGTFHTSFTKDYRLLRLFDRTLTGYAGALDRRIAVAHSAARSMQRFFNIDFEIIPNGVDIAAWSQATKLADHPEIYDGRRNIAFLGRLDPRNDIDVLLESMRQIVRQRQDVRLLIIGDGPGELALDPVLKPHVQFLGSEPDLKRRAAYLHASDLLVFPARIVAHPITILEGMAASRPIVAYDIEGVRELVHDGVQGYKAKVGDASSLAESMLSILNDETLRRRMGQGAFARVQEFDWNKIAGRIEQLYESIYGRAIVPTDLAEVNVVEVTAPAVLGGAA